METIIAVLIVVAVVAALIWVIRQIPWPAGLEIINTVLIILVVVAAIYKLWPLL